LLANEKQNRKTDKYRSWKAEANPNDLHAKFESALAHFEEELDQKDVEIGSLQADENDRLKGEHEKRRVEEVVERDGGSFRCP